MKNAQPSEKWKQDFGESIRKLVLRGDYQDALVIARKALKTYPDEFLCRYQYARLLGDWADELPAARREKLKKEAADILRPLLKTLRGQSPELRFSVCLNYYYQSHAYQDMYRFGKRFTRFNKQKGYYAQGLGACLHAFAAHGRGEARVARSWARRSVEAWKKYDLKTEKYYFAHYSFAKALALSGDSKGALQSLKTAARLSRRKLSDWEFADVLALI